ncbi:G2/mitotic-specific cyclin [Actinomortierella ambigua]|nr:G2/mitotic-specific cyclin [Actinomortierella ambigua]
MVIDTKRDAGTEHSLWQESQLAQACTEALPDPYIAYRPEVVAYQHEMDVAAAMVDESEWLERYSLEEHEYAEDFNNHYMEIERLTMPRPDYMERQTHINREMRAAILQVLREIHNKLRLDVETIFSAMNLLDRYLSTTIITANELAPSAIACLLIEPLL